MCAILYSLRANDLIKPCARVVGKLRLELVFAVTVFFASGLSVKAGDEPQPPATGIVNPTNKPTLTIRVGVVANATIEPRLSEVRNRYKALEEDWRARGTN